MNVERVQSAPIVFRSASKNDITYCRRLTNKNMGEYFARYWPNRNTRTFGKKFISEENTILEKNGRRVGYFTLRDRGEYLLISHLHISRIMQGKGIGSYVLSEIQKKAITSGFNRVRLYVFKDNPAIRLYTRSGYTIIDEREHTYVMELHIMNDRFADSL